MPLFTLTCRYTRPLLRRFYVRELWRTQGGWLISLPLALIVVVWASSNPPYWWFAGFIGGLSLAYILLVYSTYQQLLKHLVDRQATITISDNDIHVEAQRVTSELPWTAILFVRDTPEGLLLTSQASTRPLFLPSDALSVEATAFVKRKVKEAGGRTSDGA